MEPKLPEALFACPLFAGMPPERIAVLTMEGGRRSNVEKGGEVSLIFEGKSRMGIVLSGRIAVYAGQTLLNRIGPGGLFGVATLYGKGCGAPTRLVASEPCEILFLSESDVETLTEDRSVRRALLAFLTDRIRFLNQKVATFSAPCAEEKLAMYLLERGQDETILPGRSLTELASVLDLGRASLYRALNQLEEKGAIRRRRREIEILSRQTLEKISNAKERRNEK